VVIWHIFSRFGILYQEKWQPWLSIFFESNQVFFVDLERTRACQHGLRLAET
jgi:hypothetical protein